MPTIRQMTIADYDTVIALIGQTEGVTIRDADSKDAILRYLQRNPGLSFVAVAPDGLVGCIMSGHDGRRGYLQHLVVSPTHRNKGVGGRLVNACLQMLSIEGIKKSHVDVLVSNAAAKKFWANRGWMLRTDIVRYSHIEGIGANA